VACGAEGWSDALAMPLVHISWIPYVKLGLGNSKFDLIVLQDMTINSVAISSILDHCKSELTWPLLFFTYWISVSLWNISCLCSCRFAATVVRMCWFRCYNSSSRGTCILLSPRTPGAGSVCSYHFLLIWAFSV
jgi:hypothetical protein